MNRIFRTAILAMAMMISASFAWGQSNDISNESMVPNNVYLNVTATLPSNAFAEVLTATIKWYNSAGQLLEVQEASYSYHVGQAYYFPQFVTYYDSGHLPAYVVYCIRGYHTLWNTGKDWWSSGGTFDTPIIISAPTFSLNVNSNWANNSYSCFTGFDIGESNGGGIDP